MVELVVTEAVQLSYYLYFGECLLTPSPCNKTSWGLQLVAQRLKVVYGQLYIGVRVLYTFKVVKDISYGA